VAVLELISQVKSLELAVVAQAVVVVYKVDQLLLEEVK
jgi:hypothetical protein